MVAHRGEYNPWCYGAKKMKSIYSMITTTQIPLSANESKSSNNDALCLRRVDEIEKIANG